MSIQWSTYCKVTFIDLVSVDSVSTGQEWLYHILPLNLDANILFSSYAPQYNFIVLYKHRIKSELKIPKSLHTLMLHVQNINITVGHLYVHFVLIPTASVIKIFCLINALTTKPKNRFTEVVRGCTFTSTCAY